MVESLPLTSDDMHHTRSAHGSFADLLRELAQSTDFEVGGDNAGLRRKDFRQTQGAAQRVWAGGLVTGCVGGWAVATAARLQ